MATTTESTELLDFTRARDVRSKWDAARRLMANRQMQRIANEPEFIQSFDDLGQACIATEGIDQLLAIAMVVRISDLLKKDFKTKAADFLARAFDRVPEGAWLISESTGLPAEAKPAEIRENIARALDHAHGPWVVPYVVEALAREERSSRCRLELSRQLALRQPNVTQWIEALNSQPWSKLLGANSVEGVVRLRDLLGALATTIAKNRMALQIEPTVGRGIASLMMQLVRVSPREPLPPKLESAAVEAVRLMEEILATEFTLIAEAETYAPIEVLFRWWQPVTYPRKLKSSLKGIIRKLTSAITLRARMGQRSETLVSRLGEALGPSQKTSTPLVSIADASSGLLPEIDDWLRGRTRKAPATTIAVKTLLSESETSNFTVAFAPLLQDCVDAVAAISPGTDAPIVPHIRRVCNRVTAMAAELRLSIVGRVGDIVEFNPSTHRTVDGAIPSEPRVKVVRPMVIRKRVDGSEDVIERAIVAECDE